MGKFEAKIKARLAIRTENTFGENRTADSISDATDTFVETNSVAQDSPLTTYTATPAQIEEWHQSLARAVEVGLLRHFAKRDWGALAQNFINLAESSSSTFERLGFNRFGGFYTFKLDEGRYIRAQSFFYENCNGEHYRYVEGGEQFLEEVNKTLLKKK